jgi:putative ABC transport system permease protein
MARPRPFLIFQLFLRSSRVQKKRAILTVAAIAWGSLSLLLLLAFGEGLKHQMMKASTGMGANIAVIWPGETTKPWEGMPAGRPIRPRTEDIALISQRVQHIEGISGELRDWGAAYTYGKKTVNTRLTGASLVFGKIRNHYPQPGGRFLNILDEKLRRRVIFLGYELAGDLFGEEDPVSRTVLVNNVPYLVIGVMEEKLQTSTYGGPDKSHGVIPITTFQAQYGRDKLSNIVVKPDRPDRMDAVLAGIREVMGGKYGFDPTDERVMGTWDTVQSSKMMRNMLQGIQIFLGIIGALTLLVGGMGVANIMYAVVKERTRETGVKMALGSRTGWVTGPLVLEGLTYTLLGGVLGIFMATVLIMLMGLIPTEGNDALEMMGTPTLSMPIGIGTAVILGFIGLLAGYFPARRAATIDPAETLRYE